MSGITILWVVMAALSATIAGLYLAAWLMQRDAWSYLILALLSVSIAGIAGTELWMLRAQTLEEYSVALRWLHVPVWSGFCALVGLVYLRLRPRFPWVGWLAVGLRTVGLVANFLSGSNLNYLVLTGIEHFTLLGEPVATATGVPNPWMLTGQAGLLLSIVFLVDGGISAWRRGEGRRALVLAMTLLAAIVVGTVQAVLVFWQFVQWPVLITPMFLFVAAVIGSELSRGLLRAARAERDVQIKDAALDMSEQRLSLAAEAADAGFWSLAAQSGEVWATAKTRELFGLPATGGLRLAEFLDRVHRGDRAQLTRLIDAALRSDGRYRHEFRVVDRDGRVRWLAGLGRGVGGTESAAKTLMGVTVDITARRAMLDKIRRQRARLERVSRVETLAELSASLAHELNQPLAMILTNAEAAQALLAQPTPDLAELREILDDIVRADQRAADVIRHMRALLDRGEPERGALLLDEAIHRVIHLLGHEIEEQGVTVRLSLASDLPPVEADHILIEQVLVNLLSNACEAVAGNPAGERRVSIATRANADRVLVEVTDNGCGLSDPDCIFDAFYSTKAEGLGMGLAIVRSIVNSHGGRVWAQAVPAGGTAFHVSLPIDGGSA